MSGSWLQMNKIFSDIAWTEYQYWVENDKKILRKINALIMDIERNGHTGIGKPEPLKYDLEGFWSRRITEEHRLVYAIDNGSIYIGFSVRRHSIRCSTGKKPHIAAQSFYRLQTRNSLWTISLRKTAYMS